MSRAFFVNNLCYLIFRDASINNQFHSILLSVEILTKTVRGPSQSYYSKLGEKFISLETDIGAKMEDKIIELADYFISENTTYREAKIACEKLLRQVSHEIELRALESETRA
nr:MAG TPA: hypothetical protein [Caudoviricetes sp.]